MIEEKQMECYWTRYFLISQKISDLMGTLPIADNPEILNLNLVMTSLH